MNSNSDYTGMNGLDGIVREIAHYKNKEQDNFGRQIIIVERETGEILDEVPFFNFFKKLRFFEINQQKVARNVKGPAISVNYSNSPHPLVIQIDYNARINGKGVLNLITAIYQSNTPLEGINNVIQDGIEAFIFEKKNFVSELKQYLPDVESLVKKIGLQCGLDLSPEVKTNFEKSTDMEVDQFISCEHKVAAKTRDAQVVEIDHTLALTLEDSIKFRLSGIRDIKSWIRGRLDQFTNNAIIEKTYADVLVDMQDSVIKDPMQQACQQIGYELKQLITVPGLDIEKFYFETADGSASESIEYITKDTQLKISLNIVVDGRLDLHNVKTKKYIKPGFDIIAVLKRNVIEFARGNINDMTPDECFTHQFTFEDTLAKLVKTKLEDSYGFKELRLLIKFLENDLSKRLPLLQERPKKTELLGDWAERKYALWFRVLGVSKDGWYRFRANNYKTTTEELDDIARMVKNRMEHAILRTGENITGKVISNEFNEHVRRMVRQEFGIDICIHDFNEDLSDEETLFINTKKQEIEERQIRNKMLQQGETNQLGQYLKKKEDAIEAEENEEEIRKIDERIAAFKNKDNASKAQFLNQKTDSRFLTSPEMPDKEKKRDSDETNAKE